MLRVCLVEGGWVSDMCLVGGGALPARERCAGSAVSRERATAFHHHQHSSQVNKCCFSWRLYYGSKFSLNRRFHKSKIKQTKIWIYDHALVLILKFSLLFYVFHCLSFSDSLNSILSGSAKQWKWREKCPNLFVLYILRKTCFPSRFRKKPI